MNQKNMIVLLLNVHKKIKENKSSFIHEIKKFDKNDLISIDKNLLIDELKNNPLIVNDWIEWSQNKRSLNSWYLNKISNNLYEVGYINENGEKINNNYYTNIEDACSNFIINEIKNILI